MRNTHETRVGASRVIAPAPTGFAPITVPEIRDDSQLAHLSAITGFGNSTLFLFVTNTKTFERKLLTQQKFYECHDYTIRSAWKTFITEVLLINWLETVFRSRYENLHRNF
jgi:hypothetical protein